MSVFGDIWHKIAGSDAHAATPAAGAAPAATPAAATDGVTREAAGAASAANTGTPTPPTPPTPAPGTISEVDVEVILSSRAAKKGDASNWRTSIVDLMKLLDLDSGLAARKELANELNIHVGADGTAEENIALHRAVMQKLEEHGGKVPDSMKA